MEAEVSFGISCFAENSWSLVVQQMVVPGPRLLPCHYNPHRLGAFQRAAAQLHPGEVLQVSPLHFLEVQRCNTHLEDLEHQKQVGGQWKVIQDPVRTPVCEVK